MDDFLTAVLIFIGNISSYGIPIPAALFGAIVLLEVTGGIALLFGFATRITGVILAVVWIACDLALPVSLDNVADSWLFIQTFAVAGGLLQISAFGASDFSIDCHWSS